jgi:hypothetical protein
MHTLGKPVGSWSSGQGSCKLQDIRLAIWRLACPKMTGDERHPGAALGRRPFAPGRAGRFQLPGN